MERATAYSKLSFHRTRSRCPISVDVLNDDDDDDDDDVFDGCFYYYHLKHNAMSSINYNFFFVCICLYQSTIFFSGLRVGKNSEIIAALDKETP
jgi:hypothetical protein